jgi:putative drug exporter of the RND superfamily
MTERLAAACARHAWATLAAWLVVLVASVAALALVLTGFTTEGAPTNDPQSERADDRFARAFAPSPANAVSDVVVVHSEDTTVADPRFRQFVVQLESAIKEESHRIAARSYYDTRSSRLVSSDRRASVVLLSVPDDDLADAVIAEVERADAAKGFSVAITGERTRNHDFNELSERDLQHGELQFGLPAALIVLLLVFGAVVAGVIPLVMAIFAIVAAMGLVALLSQAFELSVFTVNMLTGMGLALGIDYSLFVISRYREERGYGRDPFAAIPAAGATASRAVLFSGSAFVIAMFGMLLVPNTIMRSLAAGAILVGITSVAAALTLLPALLGLLRDRVDALRLPVVGRRSYERTNPEGRFWGAVVDRVLRRPALSLALAVGLLLLLAAPVLGMNIGAQGVATLPDDLASKRGFLALQQNFPDATADPVHVLVASA